MEHISDGCGQAVFHLRQLRGYFEKDAVVIRGRASGNKSYGFIYIEKLVYV